MYNASCLAGGVPTFDTPMQGFLVENEQGASLVGGGSNYFRQLVDFNNFSQKQETTILSVGISTFLWYIGPSESCSALITSMFNCIFLCVQPSCIRVADLRSVPSDLR